MGQIRRTVVLITTAFAEDWPVIRALTEAHDVYIVRPVDKEIGAHSKWARYRIARKQQYVHQHCSGSLEPPRLEGLGIPFVDVKARKINTTELWHHPERVEKRIMRAEMPRNKEVFDEL